MASGRQPKYIVVYGNGAAAAAVADYKYGGGGIDNVSDDEQRQMRINFNLTANGRKRLKPTTGTITSGTVETTTVTTINYFD